MSLVHGRVKIVGIKPLLLHAFTVETLSLERKERTGVAGNDPEEWKRSYMATEQGQLYVDPSYVFGCLREAARYTKIGIASLQPKLSATLQVMSDKILFDRFMPGDLQLSTDEDEPVYLDIRSVKNPNTKGRNVRYRVALSPNWKTEFEILWDNTLVSKTQMDAILRDAGTLVGLADGRNIGFGRFDVVSFDVNPYEEYKKQALQKGKKNAKKAAS